MSQLLLASLLCAALNIQENATTDTLKQVDLKELEIVSSFKENGLLRQQPSSVSLINQKTMEANHITSLKGVSGLVPNLFIPDYGSRLTSAVYIRGIGSRINTPAIGLYVDDIPYVDKSAFDFGFYEIERMDVLRGPQGTLYGRNTMGGLVRIYTRNPRNYEGTDIHLGANSGNSRLSASITHYHKVCSDFAFSAGGYFEKASGFFRNDFTGKKVDGLASGGGRMRGLYTPTERLTFDININYDYSDEGAYPYFYTGSTTAEENYGSKIGKITNNRESSYRRGLLNTGVNICYKTDKWQLNAITGYQNINDRMFMDQDFLSDDIYTLEQKQRINTLTEEITLKNLGESKWKRVTGINLMRQWLHTEAPVTFYEDGLRWLEGNINTVLPDMNRIAMLKMMGFTGMSLNFRGDRLSINGTYETPITGIALFHQSSIELCNNLTASLGVRFDYEHQNMEYASPADVLYGFAMPNGNNEKMAVDLQNLESHIGYYGSLKNDNFRVLPKISLKYDFNASSNIYTSVGMGQRSGGYNIQMFSDLLQGAMRVDMMSGVKEGVGNYLDYLAATNPNMPKEIPDPDAPGQMVALPQFVRRVMAQNMPQFEVPTTCQVVYKPEYSWNFELGTHLTLADKRIILDAALFYNRIHNQQIARFAPSGLGRMMVNAGKSQSCGGEMSMTWRPTNQLTLTGNYGFTHSEFLKYDDGSGNDYSGNYVPYVPMHTVNADAAYMWNIKNDMSITLGIGCNGAGRIYWTEDNTASQAFYSQLNARATFRSKNLGITLWGKNLTDTKYNTFYFVSASRGYEQHGKPVQIGADINISF